MKKKLFKRVISASLAALMLSSTVFASQTVGFMSMTAAATGNVTVVDSGVCGTGEDLENLPSYTLYSDGTLCISGSGSVSDSAFDVACYLKADDITSVEFAEGSNITVIESYSFNSLPSLQTVTIPATVTFIGDRAFGSCPSLEEVNIDSATVLIDSNAFGNCGALAAVNITSDTVSIADSAFGNCTALTTVNIASSSVKVHPDAFIGCLGLESMNFTALDGTTIQGMIDGLPETATVSITPFSKTYKPAGKSFTGPSVAYDTYQPAYDHAVLYWEDTESIIEAAQADEAGVRISNTREELEWLTNDNISSVFPNAQASVIGTMQGDGSFANPLEIWDAANWRYLDFLARIGKISGSYYGWDRGTNVKLMADLTLSDRDGTFTTLGGEKHKEVYNNSYTYKGNFDGNGHTITLDVNESIDDGTAGFGLIERTDGAYIKNLHISGRMVSSQQYTGLLVGYLASGDRIYNCSSDAELVLEGSGEMKSGALVGYAYKPYIENCHFTGKILGGSDITAVGGFVGQIRDSGGGSTLKNCYFAPSQISVSSESSCILYRPYYGSYSGWVGFAEIENNYYNSEALKLNGDNMGDLDQGTSDSEGIGSLNETEFWDNGQLTMPKATASANPGTRRFAYTGGEHRIFMDLQADGYNGGGSLLPRGSSFPYMPGYANNGIAYYKVNDGDWSATPPVATEVGQYTVYYRAAGDIYHRDSDIQSITVTIENENTLPGSGTAGDPYTISNDLEWSIFCDMRDTKDKYFKLVNDIVVSEDRESKRGPQHPLEFNGNFDGDGHTITLYYVSRGSSDSLFGKLIGVWSYDTSSYAPVYIKNLTVDGVMYGSSGVNSPIAHEITHNATVSNVINNMTIVHLGAGGDRSVSGIVNTGTISGGAHFYNCKVGGKFSAMNGNKTFAGLTDMNDFWQSGTDFIIKDCYVNPTCEDIKVSASNYVIVGNYKEEIVTIENTFFGQSILGIIPVDEETGETTNTQGISDENGTAALDATGYWKDGNPTMPQATITKAAPEKRTIDYIEQEPVYDAETGEEIEQEPTQYPLLAEAPEADGGTVWYSVNGGDWTDAMPTATEVGLYTIRYKAVGDYLHRDGDVHTCTVTLIYEWATPESVSFSANALPSEAFGTLTTGNAAITLSWDDHEQVDACAVTATVVKHSGETATLINAQIFERSDWTTENGRNACEALLPTLGANDQQIIADGMVNGVQYGDTVVISVQGLVDVNGNVLYSIPGVTVDFAASSSNTGKIFPVVSDGVSNDSTLKDDLIVKGDEAVVECLASGGKAPYQYEVTYKKAIASSYMTAQNYSTNQMVRFTPAVATVYDVHVNVRDAEGNVAGKDFRITVNKVLGNLSTISEDEYVLGESVQISAGAEGGIEPYTYAVSYYTADSNEMVAVQDFRANQTITVTPQRAVTHYVRVSVKDKRGVVVSKEFTLKVNGPLNNISSVSTADLVIGDSVTLLADSEGGLKPFQYEIAVKEPDAADYSVVQAYAANKTLTITPEKEGQYSARFRVKDARGTVREKELAFTVHPVLTNRSVLSETDVIVNTEVTIQAQANGGIAPYQYEVSYLKNGSTDATVLQAYSSNATVSFTPSAAVPHTIFVNVKDARGVVVARELSLSVNGPLKNTTALSDSTILINTPVTVLCAGEGGIGAYRFEVACRKAGAADYTVLQDYGANTSVTFTPDESGSYEIRTRIKDTRNSVEELVLPLTVNGLLENTSVLSADNVRLSGSVHVLCSSTGGLGEKQYKVAYKKTDASSWITVQNYKTNTDVAITPDSAGSFTVRVRVKDSTGTDRVMDYPLEVYEPLVNTSTAAPERIEINKTLTIHCTSDGGLGAKTYSVLVKDPVSGEWTMLQDYSVQSSLNYQPRQSGDYIFRVKVKDQREKVVLKDITVPVYLPLSNTSVLAENRAVVNRSVSVRASAENGAGSYEFAVFCKQTGADQWTMVSDFSANANVSFVPVKAAEHLVLVKVRDADGTIVEKTLTLQVNSSLRNTSAISAAEAELGSAVRVTCSGTGGIEPRVFSVEYKASDSEEWIAVQEDSDNSAVNLQLTAAGTYSVRTSVKDARGKVVQKSFDLTVYGALTNTSSVSEEAVRIGTDLTVTASAEGGLGERAFRIQYSNPQGEWTQLQDYSDNTTVSFTPDSIGEYLVRVDAKDPHYQDVRKEITVRTFDQMVNTSTLSAMSVRPDTEVTVNASSTGGLGSKTYSILVQNVSTGKWTTLQDFSDNTSLTYLPAQSGKFVIRVKVKDERGKIVLKDISLSVFDALVNTSSLSSQSTKLGTTITIYASSTGGLGTKTYSVLVQNVSTGKWTTLQNFSANTSLSYKPAQSGNFVIRVKVKDERGKIVLKDISLNVFNNLKNTSSVWSDSIRLGYTIDVEANSTGGLGTVQYAVLYLNPNDGKWYTAQSYSTNRKVSIKPTQPGRYTIRVKAKDSRNVIVNWDHDVQVFKTIN